jgi:DNA polymerase-3 subunit delta
VQPILGKIEQGNSSPVFLFHGEEDFLVDRARDAIVAALQSNLGAEVEWVDAREVSLASVLESLLEVSLFSTRQIVVVRQAQHLAPGGKKEVETLRGILGTRGPDDNVLVLCAGQAFDKRTRLYKTIASSGDVVGFDRLKGRALRDWLADEAARRGVAITRQAQDALLARAGNSLRQIDLEMEKLSLWVQSGGEVTPDDVGSVVPRSKEDVIFDLTGALGERRLSAGLRFLRELRFRGATPLMILSMLGREIRFMLQAKLMSGTIEGMGWNEGIGFDQFTRTVWPKLRSEIEPPPGNPRYHLLGANPYVAFLVFRRARQFSFPELRSGLIRISRTDLALKSTTQSPDALLERLVIELALPGERFLAQTASPSGQR